MSLEGTIQQLRDTEIEFSKERFDYLVETQGHRPCIAAALVLSEHGFSHSGIANRLDVTGQTAKGYLDDIQTEYGPQALDTHPQYDPVDSLWPDGYRNE